jgi:hypothetical protein
MAVGQQKYFPSCGTNVCCRQCNCFSVSQLPMLHSDAVWEASTITFGVHHTPEAVLSYPPDVGRDFWRKVRYASLQRLRAQRALMEVSSHPR